MRMILFSSLFIGRSSHNYTVGQKKTRNFVVQDKPASEAVKGAVNTSSSSCSIFIISFVLKLLKTHHIKSCL